MTAKLYEDTQTNPLAGCLPPLLQIPVFIALYRSILSLANAAKLGYDQHWVELFGWQK
jgi:YidC/Oxa1 family membrane protein insertase